MTRPIRIEYPGALYHITSRGNAGEPIFLEDEDRKRFLTVLEEVVEDYQWVCHAYCLMANHYHLLIETPGGNLSSGMKTAQRYIYSVIQPEASKDRAYFPRKV
jgi:REP-associated tyrosine transposase